MRYRMSYEDSILGEVNLAVELLKTPKAVTIKPLDPKPKYTYGCIDKLWDKGQIRIVTDEETMRKRNRVPRNALKDWGDGTYTLYPERQGIPFLLTPEKEA